jgi:hypothetical protein
MHYTGLYLHAIDTKYNTLTMLYALQTVVVTLVEPQIRHVSRKTGASSLLSRLQFAKGITFVLRASSPICVSFMFSGTLNITLKFSVRTFLCLQFRCLQNLYGTLTLPGSAVPWACPRLGNSEESEVVHHYISKLYTIII